MPKAPHTRSITLRKSGLHKMMDNFQLDTHGQYIGAKKKFVLGSHCASMYDFNPAIDVPSAVKV